MYCYSCMNEIKDGHICSNCHNASANELLPHHLRPGQVLNDKYLVGNCIGEGGFGITYIGRDLVLDIKVAIKEFFPNGCVNRNNSATQNVTATTQEQKDFFNKGKLRFLEEAKNIAKFIDEPGVVSVREYFEANSTAYIIMEYLDGENLSRYVRKNGRMPAQEVFTLMLPIMKSLHRIHEAGIIHRDISPDNIMYMKNGTLKLMDFGSARFFTNEEKEMSIMLKKGYAPEEQYRKNGHQGPWTDVYGLCATIYRCITGVVPPDALDRMHEDRLKKPSQLGIQISPALEAVLMQGLSVSYTNRHKQIDTLIRDVTNALSNKVFSATPVNNLVDKTVRANEITYGDNFNKKSNTSKMPPAPKKSNTGTIVAITLSLSILILAVIAFIWFVMPMINNQDEKSTKPKATTPSLTVSAEETKSAEPQEKLIEIPDVNGKTLVDATKKLNECGFKVEAPIYVETNEVEDNHIASQYPNAGIKATEGSYITLYVAKEIEEKPEDNHYQPEPEEDILSTAEIDAQVKWIRDLYYNPKDGYEYIVFDKGEHDSALRREYSFYNGELIFAFITDGINDSRIYFKNEKMIRYTDSNGVSYDDGNLDQFTGIAEFALYEAHEYC